MRRQRRRKRRFNKKRTIKTYLRGGSKEQADAVHSDKFASSETPSNELRLRTVTFLLKFQANKILSEPLITLKTTI